MTSRFFGSHGSTSLASKLAREELEQAMADRHATTLCDMWTKFRLSVESGRDWRDLSILECRLVGKQTHKTLPAFGFANIRTAEKVRDRSKVLFGKLRRIYDKVSAGAPPPTYPSGDLSRRSDTFRASWYTVRPACLPRDRTPESKAEEQQLQAHWQIHRCEQCKPSE
jgi:hypothetical protein